MISVLDTVKTLYKSDSVIKNYFVVFRDKGIMLNNTDLITESLSITESICSSGNFKVGLCESANAKLQALLTDNVNGDEVCIFQAIGEYEPEIVIDDTKGLQIVEDNTTELHSTFTSSNIISGLDTNNFEKYNDYLVLAKFKYIGNPIYLYVENANGNSRMVYYLKPGLFNFTNLQEWDNTKTYLEHEIVLHNDFVWESLTYNNTVEPGSLVFDEITNEYEVTNTWKNITHYVQVAIPLIGSEFYEYKMGIYVNDEEEYGTLDGEATIYEMPVPIMPLGLFTINRCKRKNNSNVRSLEGYDRMQDVGLDIDVYLSGSSSIQLGQVLDEAAQGTQIVIGSNLSKDSISLIKLPDESVTFSNFPSNPIYKVSKTETQSVEGSYIEATSIQYEESTTLYRTLQSTSLMDENSSNWADYLNNRKIRIIGKRRYTTTISDKKVEKRNRYPYQVTIYSYYPYEQIYNEVTGWEWSGRYLSARESETRVYEGQILEDFGGSRWVVHNVTTRSETRYYWGDWYPDPDWTYGNPDYITTITISGVVYTIISHVGPSITSGGEAQRTWQVTYTVYRDVNYGYYYSQIDNSWTVTTSEYYTDIEDSDWVTPSGTPIKSAAYIDLEKDTYWSYSYDSELPSSYDFWEFSEYIPTGELLYPILESRQGEGYQNVNTIYSLDSIYKNRKSVYVRNSVYQWYETPVLKKTTFAIPYNVYDNTMAYTIYLTYPTDTLAYTKENDIYELAQNEAMYVISDDETYTSSGTIDINKQSDVRQSFLDNCTKVAELRLGTYVDSGGITRSSGMFDIYWVEELQYVCYMAYAQETPEQNYSLSGVIRSANPFINCVVHSQSEKFNSMPVLWGSETIHGKRRDIIAGFLELHGMFINFDRWGVSTIRNVKSSTLYPAENLYPHDSTVPGLEAYGDIYPSVGSNEVTPVSVCKSIYIDDDLNTEFDGVMISKSQVTETEASIFPFYYNRLSRRYGTLPSSMPEIGYWEGNNYYKIENNFFFDNFIFGSTAQEITENLVAICQQILSTIGDLQYFNMTAELRCLPYMEVGDNINIMTSDSIGYETAILRRTMKGNMAQMDSIETDFYT